MLCRQLLGGYDKADPDAVAPDDAYDNCARYCATACRILDSLIGDRYIRQELRNEVFFQWLNWIYWKRKASSA